MGMTPRLALCVGVIATGPVLMATPAAAQSVPLFPAQLSGANIDALFGQQDSPEDVETEIPLPGINGKAVLHSRVFRGAAGSQAQGRFAYEYRVDLSNAATFVDLSCVINLSVKFGPIEKLPYAPNSLRDVYMIKQGVPPDQIGFSSAVQTGDLVTFTFERPICAAAADGSSPSGTSFAFGLASRDSPDRGVGVQIDAIGLDDIRVRSVGPLR
jgi:hypothetical protein